MVIQMNDQHLWLHAAVKPLTNHDLHIRLYPHSTTALTEMFLGELMQKHAVEDAKVLADGVP